MATITDPAKELADVAQRLAVGSSSKGDQFLASKFQVDPWSTEFVKILSCIYERIDLVSGIVGQSNLDADTKQNAIKDLEQFKTGFAGEALRQPWNTAPSGGVIKMKDHGLHLRYLQETVRASVSYPTLSKEEIVEFVDIIDVYISSLDNDEPMHRAIVDGLMAFKFQLEYIGWMGAGYVLSAFRNVVIAYGLSERQFQGSNNPDAGLFLKGLWDFIRKFKDKVEEAKGFSDAASFVWDVYGVGSKLATPLLLTGGLPTLTG